MSEAIDRNGAKVRRGDSVKIVEIDATLLKSLPDEEQSFVRSMLNTECAIQEVADGGFAVVERTWPHGTNGLISHSLALSSTEMELTRTLPADLTDFHLDVVGCLLNDLESIATIEDDLLSAALAQVSRSKISSALVAAQSHGLAQAYTYNPKARAYEKVTCIDESAIDTYWWKATTEGKYLFGLDAQPL